MKNKIFSTLALMLLMVPCICAQHIRFDKKGLANAMERAKRESKILFIDCHTRRCGPCRMMEKQVFTDRDVADFYNRHFVNYALDMDTDEGKEFMKSVEVTAWPTLVYMNEKGQVLIKEVGARKPAEFLQLGQQALKQSKGLEQRFKEGVRDEAFLKEYFTKICTQNQLGTIQQSFETLYAERGSQLLYDEFYWKVFSEKYISIEGQIARDFCNEYEELAQKHGNEVAYWKNRQLFASFKSTLENCFEGGVMELGKPYSPHTYNKGKHNAYLKFLKKIKVPHLKEIKKELTFLILLEENKKEEAILWAEKSLKKADAYVLRDWCALAAQRLRGEKYRLAAAEWGKRALTMCGEPIFQKEVNFIIETLVKYVAYRDFPKNQGYPTSSLPVIIR